MPSRAVFTLVLEGGAVAKVRCCSADEHLSAHRGRSSKLRAVRESSDMPEVQGKSMFTHTHTKITAASHMHKTLKLLNWIFHLMRLAGFIRLTVNTSCVQV
eukprot:5678-Heterococcus_DN1.PRE.2